MAIPVPAAASVRLARSVGLRVQAQLRRARMAPRRRRAVAELCAARPGPVPPPAPVPPPGPAATPGLAAAEPLHRSRVLVVGHVFYPELWPELAAAVDRLGVPADLVVSLVAGASEQLAPLVRERFPDASVHVGPNLGRDMWPMLQALDRIDGHDAVLKLHTKRSPHRRRGDRWRTRSLEDLCASPEAVAAILRVLDDPRIGMVAPDGCVLGREFLGPNRRLVHELAARGGIRLDGWGRLDGRDLWFPAGSMFWATPDALAPLRRLGLTDADFAAETGALDGTLAHALERYLGVALAAQDLAVVEARDVSRLLAAPPGRMGP